MRYRVHRMKDIPQEAFRWAAHTGGVAVVKPKDYEPGVEIEAISPYAAWKSLGEAGDPLRPGDLVESLEPGPAAALQIAKYIGFEPAQWFIPEHKPEGVGGAEAHPDTPSQKQSVVLGNPA